MIDEATVQALLARMPEDESVLDCLVHDAFSKQASAVNNGGFESQIRWLLENGYTEADITQELGS